MSQMQDQDDPAHDNPAEVARRRATYRAWHRGTKELDFILGHYCDAHIKDFDAERLALFERLMAHEETHLQQWLMGQMDMPEGEIGAMLGEIRLFHLSLGSQSGPIEK